MEYKNIIIGAGGFGKVYLKPNGNVIKAIYKVSDCKDAEKEFAKQQIAYDVFKFIRSLNFGIKLLDDVKNNIIVSKPLNSNNNKLYMDDNEFSCSFEMEKLHGLPLWMYKKLNQNSLNNLSFDYINDNGSNFEIMVHLSLNFELKERFYGVNYSKTKISNNNPPRGYFIVKEQNFIANLQNNFNFKYNSDNILEIIGFIYGALYFFGDLIPIDIEITLGYNPNGTFDINVIDFGMCIDIRNVDIHAKDVKVDRILKALRNNVNQNDLEIIVKEELSLDLYCDMEDDKFCNNGWELAKQFSIMIKN